MKRELRLSDDGGLQALEDAARLLVERFHAVLESRADGPDQSYWDYDIGGAKVTLHREHYLGVSLLARDEAGEAAVRKVAGALEKR